MVRAKAASKAGTEESERSLFFKSAECIKDNRAGKLHFLAKKMSAVFLRLSKVNIAVGNARSNGF